VAKFCPAVAHEAHCFVEYCRVISLYAYLCWFVHLIILFCVKLLYRVIFANSLQKSLFVIYISKQMYRPDWSRRWAPPLTVDCSICIRNLLVQFRPPSWINGQKFRNFCRLSLIVVGFCVFVQNFAQIGQAIVETDESFWWRKAVRQSWDTIGDAGLGDGHFLPRWLLAYTLTSDNKLQ